MSEAESVRLIGEVIAVLVVLGGGAAYITRQIWRVLRGVEDNTEVTAELAAHMKAMNGSVQEHLADDAHQFGNIKIKLGRIEGRLGLPPAPEDEP